VTCCHDANYMDTSSPLFKGSVAKLTQIHIETSNSSQRDWSPYFKTVNIVRVRVSPDAESEEITNGLQEGFVGTILASRPRPEAKISPDQGPSFMSTNSYVWLTHHLMDFLL
jgi:hypothetical protein